MKYMFPVFKKKRVSGTSWDDKIATLPGLAEFTVPRSLSLRGGGQRPLYLLRNQQFRLLPVNIPVLQLRGKRYMHWEIHEKS